MCLDFTPNFGDKELAVTSLQCMISCFIFHGGIVYEKQHDCHPPPTLFLFPQLKIKLKGRHFDTTEAIETESQAVLNTLTEYDLDIYLKNGRSTGNASNAEDYFKGDGGQ
jgi:hypothetical protein